MVFPWQGLFREWLKHEGKARQWKEDAVQGWRILRTGATSLADRSFSEAESLQLRYRLEKVNQKIAQAYRMLGKKAADHWSRTGTTSFTEEVRKQESRRIHLLLEEQKKILDQIRQLEESFVSHKETKS